MNNNNNLKERLERRKRILEHEIAILMSKEKLIPSLILPRRNELAGIENKLKELRGELK